MFDLHKILVAWIEVVEQNFFSFIRFLELVLLLLYLMGFIYSLFI